MRLRIVLGTHNQKKLRELRELLPEERFELATLADYSDALVVEETGTTFSENAALKATVQARHLRQWVLGEDSGLCVDALDGAPGVYSARFSGAEANDARNNERLLQALQEVPDGKRTARYECHLCLADPSGQVRLTASGICRGRILRDYHGAGGFGYDPLFEIPEYHQTFGQLGAAVKRAISHRARALRVFLSLISAESLVPRP